MVKEIINYICDVAIKHKAVRQTKYQKRILINAQGNNRYIQFIVEDDGSLEHHKINGTMSLFLNIDILGQPKTEDDILAVQNLAFQVGTEVIAYIKRDEAYKNLISVADYDYLFLSHFSDDVSSGVRITLELIVPEPINLCDYLNNFDFENNDIEENDDNELNLKPLEPFQEEDEEELELSPIKLTKK